MARPRRRRRMRRLLLLSALGGGFAWFRNRRIADNARRYNLPQ